MRHVPGFGVEEEFLLVDPETGEPAPHNSEVAAQAQGRPRRTVRGPADSVDDHSPVLARQQLGSLVQRARPALDEYNSVTTELDRIMAQGNGAMRQRKVWQQRGDMMDVINQAAAATVG